MKNYHNWKLKRKLRKSRSEIAEYNALVDDKGGLEEEK